MDVTIAAIAPEHIDSFHRTLDVVARERKYLAFLEAPPLEATRAFVRNNIASGHVQLVALANGEVVGWCDVLPNERPVYAHCGVLGLGLLPAFRGRGNGTALLRATLAAAWTRGFVRIQLTAHADNVRAIALYEKFGFNKEGELQDAVLVDGHYGNVIVMALVDRSRGLA